MDRGFSTAKLSNKWDSQKRVIVNGIIMGFMNYLQLTKCKFELGNIQYGFLLKKIYQLSI